MKKLAEYILEKHGYVDLEDFVDEVMSTILQPHVVYIPDDILKNIIDKLFDHYVIQGRNSARGFLTDIKEFNHYAFMLNFKREISGSNILEQMNSDIRSHKFEYTFKKGKNENPDWLNELHVEITQIDYAQAAIDPVESKFTSQSVSCALRLSYRAAIETPDISGRNMDFLLISAPDHDLEFLSKHKDKRDELYNWIFNRIKDKLKFTTTPTIKKEQLKPLLMHELSHAYDMYLAHCRKSNYLLKSIGDDYIDTQDVDFMLERIEDIILMAGYALTDTEWRAMRQSLIYSCKANELNKEDITLLYKDLDNFEKGHSSSYNFDISNNLPDSSINLLFTPLTYLVAYRNELDGENSYYDFDHTDMEKSIDIINKKRVFKIIFKNNKDMKTMDDLRTNIDKLIPLYIKKLRDLLNTISKHLVK